MQIVFHERAYMLRPWHCVRTRDRGSQTVGFNVSFPGFGDQQARRMRPDYSMEDTAQTIELVCTFPKDCVMTIMYLSV